jgi:hypothetical protein
MIHQIETVRHSFYSGTADASGYRRRHTRRDKPVFWWTDPHSRLTRLAFNHKIEQWAGNLLACYGIAPSFNG